jgi:hypothetical protein
MRPCHFGVGLALIWYPMATVRPCKSILLPFEDTLQKYSVSQKHLHK